MTDEMLTEWGMKLLVPAFICFLLFIIYDLAKESKAGKIGTLGLFLALGFGFLGYMIKVFLHGKWKNKISLTLKVFFSDYFSKKSWKLH